MVHMTESKNVISSRQFFTEKAILQLYKETKVKVEGALTKAHRAEVDISPRMPQDTTIQFPGKLQKRPKLYVTFQSIQVHDQQLYFWNIP